MQLPTVSPQLTFVLSPARLPKAPTRGRVVLLDLAFAYGGAYFSATQPFIRSLGENLVAWIDHHPHPAWGSYQSDPRFTLRDRSVAPACPELLTPELVGRLGAVHHVFAHADFDGCIAAVKLLRHGVVPWREADEDARAVDAPGRGFSLSAQGERLALAIDQAESTMASSRYLTFLHDLATALVVGQESLALRDEIEQLASAQRRRLSLLSPLLAGARAPHPRLRLLSVQRRLSKSDRKALLRALEEQATVAIVDEGGRTTVATYDDSLDLRELTGMSGTAGYVWGKSTARDLVRQLGTALG